MSTLSILGVGLVDPPGQSKKAALEANSSLKPKQVLTL